jgi:hypothetical protein
VSKSPNSPVLQIMLRKFAHDYAADGVVADAMRDAAAEIDRLNEWADGMTDTVLRERKAADALIKELQAKLAARPEGGALEECTIKRDAMHIVVSLLAGKLMLENETLVGMLKQAEEELRAKRWLS